MNYATFIDETINKFAHCPAVSDGTTLLTYAEFGAATNQAAASLQSLGLNRGDAILIFAENRIEHLILLVAAARLGLIFAPIHHAYRARELDYVLGNARPRVAFVEEKLRATFLEAVSRSDCPPAHVISLDGEGDVISYAQFLSAKGVAETIDVEPDHPLLLVYTSGTTSMPKPVLRSHSAERWSAETYCSCWNFKANDKVLIAMSLAWVYGISSQAQSAIAAGAFLRILPRFNPVRVLEVIERERITTFAGSVSMYPMLLDVLDQQEFDVSSIEKIFGGSEARNEVAIANTEQRFGQRLYEAYALAEAFPAISLTPPIDANASAGSMGRRVSPESEVRLVGPDGQDVAIGEIGEAWLRSPGRMLEYYREPELTAARISHDGWLRTGDLLRQTEDGQYFFEGRQTDMIIRGGINISPLEIEAVLIEHPDVYDALVTGVPNPTKGQDIIAGIVLQEGRAINVEEIYIFLGENLSAFKIPQKILLLKETPTGKTGKKDRNALKGL
jgi:long-chain acyl-CoA synthetase